MFVIEVPYFNLDHIYDSKQVPRWIKLKESKYVVLHKNHSLKIEQQRDKYDLTRYRLIMSCSEEDFYNIWFDYFDLKTDYQKENINAKMLGGKFKVPANRGHGIHIIKQDNFESYVYAKLIKYAGYDKAKVAMNHIAEACGIKHIQSMREAGKVTWYEWPSPEMILNKFDKLKKMGKINSWLKNLCEDIVYNGYELFSENDLFKLFGMHDISAFPTEGVLEVIERNFKMSIDDFENEYLDGVENKGLIYLYILHHISNKPKEVE